MKTHTSGKLIIISDNPKYPPREEPEEGQDIQIIGRVHCAITKVEWGEESRSRPIFWDIFSKKHKKYLIKPYIKCGFYVIIIVESFSETGGENEEYSMPLGVHTDGSGVPSSFLV